MELNDKYSEISEKILNAAPSENSTVNFRDIHIRTEAVYENLKMKRSSFVYKMFFFFLFSVSSICFILHIFKYKLSFGLAFLVILMLYYFYFNYNVKMSLKKHIKSKSPAKTDPENPEFLKSRIKYVSEGILVSLDRAILLRNFYITFFPLFSFILVDIIKGPLSLTGYLINFAISAILGALIWYNFFKLDINKINDDIEELKELELSIQNN